MRKIYFSVIAAIVLCMMNIVGFAEGLGGANLADKMLNIIILAGVAFFAIGMTMILLALFVGRKNKKTDDEYYELDEADDEEEAVEAETEADSDDGEDEASEDKPDNETDAENADSSEEDAVDEEEAAGASEKEEIAADEGSGDENDEDKKAKANVRITFTGMNNSDVKIVELFDSITLGRKNDNDIVVADGAVSGKHCEFTYEDNTVYITDLDSTNGTLLNDEAVVRAAVNSGDTIIVGKYKYKINITVL